MSYIKFFVTVKKESYCSGCGRQDIENFARHLCRSCYVNWMRQKKKWKNREKYSEVKGIYRDKIKKIFGENPHCNLCGVRSFIPNIYERQNARQPRPDNVIQIHHIDGDKNNNDIKNLEILCGHCHKIRHYQLSPEYKKDYLTKF